MKVMIERFDFPNKKDQGYLDLMKEVRRRGIRIFNAFGDENELPEHGTIYQVDTDFLFDNQLNTKEGVRLFDCRILANHKSKRIQGYILYEGNGFAELQELRQNTFQCGYCGHQEMISEFNRNQPWCKECVDSQYLKEDDLHLLRLLPVSLSFSSNRTDDPPQWLVQSYKERQQKANELRLKKRHQERLEDIEKQRSGVNKEYTFKHALNYVGLSWQYIDNLIYYRHNDTFCFGYRTRLSQQDKDRITQAVKNAELSDYKITFKND